MLLIEPDLIRNRLSLQDEKSVNDALRSAILGASPRLEAILQTSFAKASAVDLFYIDKARQCVINGAYLLKLSNGFLRSSPAVTIEVSDDLKFVQPTALTLADMVKSSAELGFLYISDEYAEKYIRVVYDYGFQSSGEVPEWLREVTLCYTIKVLSMQQTNDRKEELSAVYSFVDSHSNEILDKHLRTSSYSIHAIRV